MPTDIAAWKSQDFVHFLTQKETQNTKLDKLALLKHMEFLTYFELLFAKMNNVGYSPLFYCSIE